MNDSEILFLLVELDLQRSRGTEIKKLFLTPFSLNELTYITRNISKYSKNTNMPITSSELTSPGGALAGG
jgi:hypothetical protein